jgi:hemerythrin superfamily protein
MNPLLRVLSPSVTNMIRMDHAHVTSLFHQYHPHGSPAKNQALADNARIALAIHGQLEEEIFYPALRELAELKLVDKSLAEHTEMHRLIDALAGMRATDSGFDAAFNTLMRDVLHHVADEETTLLPAAERLLPERLAELGARMARRRAELTVSHAGELASSFVRALPESGVVLASGAVAAGAYLFNRAIRSVRPRA